MQRTLSEIQNCREYIEEQFNMVALNIDLEVERTANRSTFDLLDIDTLANALVEVLLIGCE